MKRLSTVIGMAISTLVLVALAEQAEAGKMYAGIKGGANFANLSDIDDSSSRTGFQGGLYVGTQVSEEFGFQVEGLWVQKGAEGTFLADDGDPHTGTARLDYLEFPLLFVYHLPAGETMTFNLFAGPTVGFNMGAELELEGHGTEDVKDGTESFEFGAAIGAGIEKKMASGKAFGVDVRYSLGATPITKDTVSGDPEPKNRGVGVMAYFQFPMGAQ